MKFTKILAAAALTAAVSSTAALAQEKGSASKAAAYLTKGEMTEAQAEINKAVTYEKFKLSSKGKSPVIAKDKTLDIKGDIYTKLAQDKEASTEEVTVAIDSVLSAYNEIKSNKEVTGKETPVYKAIWVDQPDQIDPITMQPKLSKISNFYNFFINEGALAWQEEEFKNAKEEFDLALRVKTDTTAAQNALYATINILNDTDDDAEIKALQDEVVKYAKVLFSLGMNDAVYYKQLLYYASQGVSDIEGSIDELGYEVREAENTIERSSKTVESSKERYEYYATGGGRRTSNSSTRAKQAKAEMEEAQAEVAAAQTKLDEANKKIDALKLEANKFYQESLDICIEGLKYNADDADLSRSMIIYYLKLDKMDEAIASAKANIAKDPKDAAAVLLLAQLYDQATDMSEEADHKQKYTDLAIGEYKKALELDSENTTALYSLARLYYNQSVAYNAQLQELPTKGTGQYIDAAKAKELETAKKESADKAVPYAKKAAEVGNDEPKYLQLLLKIYYQTGDQENMKKIDEKLSSME
ncbi:tetratricopeptide repeat protein [Flammeovirga pacifica]|uniref:Tetratricopeptide repeat protein n=1 Tax=Flammeovirga pacifica TaxID=915059 RepID=A0A1S1Z2U3_FLAPC|nr:hypothetical protein [Flammeovirga pacifica]OHX67552.1 hypothetical protein NH26_14955 [Flammeovirga pacifica]